MMLVICSIGTLMSSSLAFQKDSPIGVLWGTLWGSLGGLWAPLGCLCGSCTVLWDLVEFCEGPCGRCRIYGGLLGLYELLWEPKGREDMYVHGERREMSLSAIAIRFAG